MQAGFVRPIAHSAVAVLTRTYDGYPRTANGLFALAQVPK